MAASQSNLNTVQELYIAFYDRPADQIGLGYWANILASNGGNIQSILSSFVNSPEAQNLYGTITSSNVGNVINQIYEDLFNRSAGSNGIQYWTSVYDAHPNMSPGELAWDILNGAQGSDVTTINNKLQAANVFTDTFGSNYSSSTIPIAKDFINQISSSTDVANITPTTIDSLINNPSSSSSTTTTTSTGSTSSTNTTGTTSTGSTSPSTTIVMPSNISTLSDNTTLQFNDNYNTSTSNGATTSTYSTININNPSILNSMNILFDNSHSNNITIDGLTLSPGVSTINISDTGSGSSGITNTISQLNDNALTNLNIDANNNLNIQAISDTTNNPVSINLSGAGILNLGSSDSFNTSTLTINDNSTNQIGSQIYLSDYNLSTLNLSGAHQIDIIIQGAPDNSLQISSINTKGVNIGNMGIFLGSPQTCDINLTNGNNTLTWETSTITSSTNNIILGNGNNTVLLSNDDNTSAWSNQDYLKGSTITNNITVGGGNNIITNENGATGGYIVTNVTLNSPNQDINHFTGISDYTDTGESFSDNFANLTLTFSNTINPNNSSASTIAQAPGTGSTFLADLNQAIAAAASLNTPFAYFNVADSSVPGHPNSSSGTDTVIVDHSQTNTGTTFVPGQDAFIVLLGVSITAASVASGAIHVTA
jgi:hypothetical protein